MKIKTMNVNESMGEEWLEALDKEKEWEIM